ncbi:hypothetical protein TWF281_009061 [Arthrobotrys megalospora]
MGVVLDIELMKQMLLFSPSSLEEWKSFGLRSDSQDGRFLVDMIKGNLSSFLNVDRNLMEVVVSTTRDEPTPLMMRPCLKVSVMVLFAKKCVLEIDSESGGGVQDSSVVLRLLNEMFSMTCWKVGSREYLEFVKN